MSRPLHHRTGFTLLETMLAVVIGSVVLGSALGVFSMLSRSDRVFARRYTEATDLAMTQRIFRKAMLTPVIAPTQGSDRNLPSTAGGTTTASDEPTERPRIIIEPDTGTTVRGTTPQRFEIVLGSPPTPASMNGAAALWARQQDVDPEDQNYSSDPTGGMIRGVFELRPDGSREEVMRQLGIDSLSWRSNSPRQREQLTALGEAPQTTWTLWWRPMPRFETNMLFDGADPLSDFEGDSETRALRLAQAVPLARGLTMCRWSVFKDRERKYDYTGEIWDDLPAYVEMELETVAGHYANWLFEISWTVADDVSNLGADLDGDGGDDPNNTGGGGGPDGRGDGRDLGGPNRSGGGGRGGPGGGDGRGGPPRGGEGQSERFTGGRDGGRGGGG